MGFYNAVFAFFTYAFLGWCIEVIYAAVNKGAFVNRGFLNGPVCPVYGIGVVIVVWCLKPLVGNLLVLYICSVLLTSALELATGFVMEKVFRHRWWDYSNVPLNIGGYICLKFSLLWGVGCVIIVDIVYPITDRLAEMIPYYISVPVLALFSVLLTVDLVLTVTKVAKLNRSIKQLAEIGAAIRAVSDKIGNEVADRTIAITEKGGELQASLKEKQSELHDKYERLREKMQEKSKAVEREHSRLFKAFPSIRSIKYGEISEELRTHFAQLRESRKKNNDVNKNDANADVTNCAKK